ncbi:MAG: 50S ribosome-binding GTPase [Microbacteriaceae bacterium]|nr:50S ribosome-binding GTPase [Microbacteriaceae bacterium]
MAVDGWSEAEFRAKWEEAAADVGRFNLAIFGKTGVGKSTLINAVFGEDLAPTGIGQPVTMDSRLYQHPAVGPLGIYDTRGLEIGADTEDLIRDLDELIQAKNALPLFERIHVAWYCVRAGDRRFEDTEAELIRRLHAVGLPVIVVLTQVPTRDERYHPDALELAEHITSLGLPIVGGRPVLVMASGDEFRGEASHGLKELVDATFRAAPEGTAHALAAAQRVDLERKRKQAIVVISAASAAAAAIGAVPIPIADAGLLVPVQLTMVAKISQIFRVRLGTAAVAAAVVPSLATSAGRAVVAGLLKVIPGAGAIVGGIVSAGTASVVTGAMGYAWLTVSEQLTLGRFKGVDGAPDKAAIGELFSAEFKQWFARLLPGRGKAAAGASEERA